MDSQQEKLLRSRNAELEKELAQKIHDLEIEAALERVRASTIAMQRSEELAEAVFILFQQFKELGENPDQATIGIVNENEWVIEYWVTMYGSQINKVFKFSIDEPNVTHRIYQSWKEQQKSLVIDLTGKELYDFTTYRASMGGAAFNPDEERRVINVAFFSKGLINVQSSEARSAESIRLLERFAGVFDGTYTRFLDLQKAETQAREAQIELALERVRARSMAMQQTNELKEVVTVVFEKLQELEIAIDGGVAIQTFNEGSKDSTLWVSSPEHLSSSTSLNLPYPGDSIVDHALISDIWNAKDNKIDLFNRTYPFEEKNTYFRYLFAHNDYKSLPESVRNFILERECSTNSAAIEKNSAIIINNYSQQLFSKKENEILKRFARVFEQSYIRFLDLQKAEAQAREAQIEAALEKVRSRSLAMHKTNELQEVVNLVFDRLQAMGIEMDAVNISVPNEKTREQRMWIALNGIPYPNSIILPYHDDPISQDGWKAWDSGLDFFCKSYSFDEKNEFFNWAFKHSDLKYMPSERKSWVLQREAYAYSLAIGKISIIQALSYSGKLLDAKENEILKRFAKVFEQAYIRFLDLQKAEMQAREAQIEAALERVRAKTMAMHTSEHVGETVATMFDELVKLGIENTARCGIAIIGNNQEMELWRASYNTNGEVDMLIGRVDMTIHPLLKGVYHAWKNKQAAYSYELTGEDQEAYFRRLNNSPDYAAAQFDLAALPAKQTNNAFFFPEGCVYAFTIKPLSEDAVKLFKRFASVFGQTYRRYLDLQRAEAQAREAQIEAGLERVRSRTMAMQKSDELAQTAVVVFKQLIDLGIQPNRLFIGIIKDDSGDIELWATDEDGSKISTRFTGNVKRNQSVNKMYKGWKALKKSLTIDMQGQELKDYFHYLAEELKVPFKLGLSQKRRVQLITYFSQGFIGMASPEPQPEETTSLLERFAGVFNLTYTRFNDLKIAEAHAIQAEEDLIKLHTEKKRAEDALTELQAAQKQLVQSEKMASLGELTAGIAHEIQNPLNFVNNFSDVNQEMIEELEEELKAGNIEEALAIAVDIKQNEQKINHHGKRADGIVKGMLQHSRTGGGEKQPTNINILADEFLRLSYHGLRAKDKAFNSEMVTHFDPELPKINVLPQDIGRVLLNLFNNAFYAVNQKHKALGTGYKPQVSVTTLIEGGLVIIKVKDNGIGIPDAIKEKIMQPFFTTKPTGEGTGLGLSLTYDMVVKGHGGKIDVNTKEGEYTEFVIALPLSEV